MAKNAIQISVKVVDDSYLPSRDRVVQWLTDQYDSAIELAGLSTDGTTTMVKQAYPCVDISKDE